MPLPWFVIVLNMFWFFGCKYQIHTYDLNLESYFQCACLGHLNIHSVHCFLELNKLHLFCMCLLRFIIFDKSWYFQIYNYIYFYLDYGLISCTFSNIDKFYIKLELFSLYFRTKLLSYLLSARDIRLQATFLNYFFISPCQRKKSHGFDRHICRSASI